MPYAILRVEKLSSIPQVQASGKHTYREQATPNADPKVKNQIIIGPAGDSSALVSAVNSRIDSVQSERKIRKDAVRCLEFMITRSPDVRMKDAEYFGRSIKFLQEKFGSDNLISAVIHQDETTPHLVAYIVPITADKRLSAKDYIGSPKKLSDLQTSFYESVAKDFKLDRGVKGSKARHQEVKKWYTQERKNRSEQKKFNAKSEIRAMKGHIEHLEREIDHYRPYKNDVMNLRQENMKLKEFHKTIKEAVQGLTLDEIRKLRDKKREDVLLEKKRKKDGKNLSFSR